MTDSPDIVEVTTTLPDERTAIELASELIAQRLAACVQVIGPMTSVYFWQGTVHREIEYKLTIKSVRRLLESLKKTITAYHPYDIPEILVIDILQSSESYAIWLNDQLRAVHE